MAFLLKKQYKLPYDICNKINLICINELIVNINKRILHMQLMSYFQTDIIYSMHEFYFVQLLVFLQKLKPLRAKYNNDYDVYDISLREETINIYHYRLYRDHINIFLYQNKEYHIYYNQFE
tara:strand:- start:5065 stop:5427 length:363 start_codon:yes stop_codon:yes gene_type:complete